MSRNLLHCHHVHGGLLVRDHHLDPQLSPQNGGHTPDAGLGEYECHITRIANALSTKQTVNKVLSFVKVCQPDPSVVTALQVAVIFLQWLPWLLKMGRPGEKITRKTIMMAKKMKELDIKETSSKSLLSNVLDMDDDFRRSTLPRIATQIPHPSHVKASQNNPGILR